MSQFDVRPLVGGGFLVEGTDSKGQQGQNILKSEAWAEVLEYRRLTAATDKFDEAVKAHFAPLVDAAENLRKERDLAPKWSKVVIEQPVEGTQAQQGVSFDLDEAGQILYILDQGRDDLLEWVGGTLVAFL